MDAKNRPILIVDDNKAHRSLVVRAIKKAAIENPIIEAASLAEARHSLFDEGLDGELSLAVIDLNLGDGRGTDLIREMRDSSDYGELPVIVLSTSALQQDIDESYSIGANYFMTKADDAVVFRKEIAEGVRYWLSQAEDNAED